VLTLFDHPGFIHQYHSVLCVLVLTSFIADEKVFPAIKAGAMGYLLKDTGSRELIDAIRKVHHVEPSMHPEIAKKVLAEIRQPARDKRLTPKPLTEREMEVLMLVAKGKSNKEIATELQISLHTACTHVNRILNKLHLANRVQATLYALREGVSSLELTED
jgi:NarL family two-component system response regulator LiaR